MQGGKLAAQYDKESKGERNLAFKPVSPLSLSHLPLARREVLAIALSGLWALLRLWQVPLVSSSHPDGGSVTAYTAS